MAENDGHLIHGVNSRKRSLFLVPIRRDMRAAILSDTGHNGDDPPARALSIIIDQLIEARLIAQSYFEFLAATGGPITTKGRQRRAVEGWSRASDRVAKFAQMIGLDKRTRRVSQTPREWLEGLPDGRDQHDQEGGSDDEQAPADATRSATQIEPTQTDRATETAKPRLDADSGTEE